MADRETGVKNFSQTTLTSEMGATGTTANVDSTAAFPSSPAILVIEPDSSSRREVILFDGTFTSTSFVTSTTANRYLEGSAAASGLTHPVGAFVHCAPLAQHIEDANDRIDALDSAKAADPHTLGGAAHSADTLANLNSKVSDATLDTSSASRTPSAHDLGGAAHSADTLANLNAKISDATLTGDHGGLTGLADDDHTQYAKLAGDTFTGEVVAPDVRFGLDTSLATTGTVTLDFSGDGFGSHTLTGNATYASSNLATGRSVSVRVEAGASTRTLAFPAGWTFVSPKPTSIAENKTGVLTVTAFGAADTDVVAAWAVEA